MKSQAKKQYIIKNTVNKYTYLSYLIEKSELSQCTQRIYAQWVIRCCKYYNRGHILDVSPDDIDCFRLWLLTERHYSPASSTVVYNAFRHIYAVLLRLVDPAEAERYAHLFKHAPRQQYALPASVSQGMMQRFLKALPNTAAGNIIRMVYATSKPFESVVNGDMAWKCNRNYAAHVCARAARKVGIPHGFGLSGIRSTSIIHRIQRRENDMELKAVLEDSGLSASQFVRYLKAAGVSY